jgi:hypothetical protein
MIFILTIFLSGVKQQSLTDFQLHSYVWELNEENKHANPPSITLKATMVTITSLMQSNMYVAL